MTETAEKLTDVDGEAGTAQYNLLVGALASLSRGDHTPELILDSYLLRALSTGGWAPELHRLRALRGARAAHRVLGAARRHGLRRLPAAGIPGARRGDRPAARRAADRGLDDGGRVRCPCTAARPRAWWPATCSGIWNVS